MKQSHHEIASLLIDLEAVMRNSGHWSEQVPPARALASVEPFCVDTLDLHEWLQFVFIPNMYTLLDAEAEMPAKCEIHPVAEEFFDASAGELLRVIARLDEIITAA